MRVDLRHLRCFVEVVRQQGVSRAAERLHVAQSALTTTIQQLEADLGLRLFDRTGRSMVLTSAGREFLPQAERLLQDFELAVQDAKALGQGRRGHVVVAAVPSIVAFVLPQAIATFARAYPNVSVTVHEDSSSRVEAMVARREADFGISSPLDEPAGVRLTPLLADQFAVVFRADHPFARRKTVRWADLQEQQLVGFSPGSRLALHLQHLTAATGAMRAAAPRYQVSNTNTIRALVQEGLGVCALPRLTAEREPLNTLECRLLVEPSYRRPISLIEHEQRSATPAAAALLELVRAHLPALARVPGLRLLGSKQAASRRRTPP
jgi:DNA-binding transcriptional LysR family regulator